MKKEKDQVNSFKPFISKFMSWVEYGLKHDFYKVNISSLNLLFNIMDLIITSSSSSEYKKIAEQMVEMMIPKFKSNDIDQELKQTIVITMGNLLKDMGHVISSNNLSTIFSIFLEKTANENLRTLIFNWLTKAICQNPELKVEAYLSKFMTSLLENINKNNVILQRQTLDFLTAISQNQPNALNGFDEQIAKSLNSLLNETNLPLFNVIYDLLSQLTNSGFAYSKNKNLLTQSVEATLKSFELDNNESNFAGALRFLENSINLNCVDSNKLGEFVTQILKFNHFNLTKARVVAILSKKIGNAASLVTELEKKVALFINIF